MLLLDDGGPIYGRDVLQVCQDGLQRQSVDFLRDLSCCDRAPSDRPSLCLLQGEQATLQAQSVPGLLVGSQDATTCVIAVLSCPATGVVWAAHMDSPTLGDQDVAALEAALAQMQAPQLHVAGGYVDVAGAGPLLAQAFLQLLHSLQARIRLRLCCVAAANTRPDGAPATRQLLLDTATWQPHPWLFGDRGPEVPRRFAAQRCRVGRHCSTLLNVWDQQAAQLVLPAVDPCCVGSWQVLAYEQMLLWSDARLLQTMSTSPLHEPDWFTQDIRDKMSFIIAAQEPHSPERLAAASTRRYCCRGSSWQRVDAAGQPPGTMQAGLMQAAAAGAGALVRPAPATTGHTGTLVAE